MRSESGRGLVFSIIVVVIPLLLLLSYIVSHVSTADLVMLFTLAFSDAINPCAIYVYTLLLTATALSTAGQGEKKLLLYTGSAFLVAVYTGYYLLGAGLIAVLARVPSKTFSVIAIIFGTWVLVSGIAGKSRIAGKSSVFSLVRKASTSIFFSFLLGATITFTLLPCSAGPYVVFAGLASKYAKIIAYTLLAVYNLVFISPLILVLAFIYYSMNYEKVQKTIIRYNKQLSVIAGLLLVLVGLYMLV